MAQFVLDHTNELIDYIDDVTNTNTINVRLVSTYPERLNIIVLIMHLVLS